MKHSTKKFYSKFDQARVLARLFESYSLSVMVMKIYSDDNDIDVVLINPNQYSLAINLLVSNNWNKKNNLSKLRERDKDFFYHPDYPNLVHLHQHFSWNTVVYLDAGLIWKRKRQRKEVFLPSHEDELLIIAAHSLFENQCVIPEELNYGKDLLSKAPDLSYMQNHAAKFNWESGVTMIADKLNKSNPNISFFELAWVRAKKVLKDLVQGKFSSITNELVAYMLVDLVWNHESP